MFFTFMAYVFAREQSWPVWISIVVAMILSALFGAGFERSLHSALRSSEPPTDHDGHHRAPLRPRRCGHADLGGRPEGLSEPVPIQPGEEAVLRHLWRSPLLHNARHLVFGDRYNGADHLAPQQDQDRPRVSGGVIEPGIQSTRWHPCRAHTCSSAGPWRLPSEPWPAVSFSPTPSPSSILRSWPKSWCSRLPLPRSAGSTVLAGAVVGGILVGQLQTMIGGYVTFIGSDLVLSVTLMVVIVVLLVRPNGLFGKVRVERV